MLITFIGYLLITTTIGLLAGRKQNSDSFWVNGRRTGIILLIGSIVSTQVGAGALLGIASASFEGGTGLFVVSCTSLIIGFGLLYWLTPRIKAFGDGNHAITLSEYLGHRFDRKTQTASALVIALVYISFLSTLPPSLFPSPSIHLPLTLNSTFL